MKKFFTQILTDETGSFSSKRTAGLLCTLALIAALIMNTTTHGDIKPSDALVNAVSLLAFGALGLTSLDKWNKKK
jgi:hypothetical protein